MSKKTITIFWWKKKKKIGEATICQKVVAVVFINNLKSKLTGKKGR